MTDLVQKLVGALEGMLALDEEDHQRYPGDEDVCKEVRDARAALSEAKAGGWKSMESAPRDGSMFLCWVEAMRYGETDDGQQYQQDVSQVDFCQWRIHADVPDGGWFDPCCGQIGDAQHVTAWQPLPAPPAQKDNT